MRTYIDTVTVKCDHCGKESTKPSRMGLFDIPFPPDDNIRLSGGETIDFCSEDCLRELLVKRKESQ